VAGTVVLVSGLGLLPAWNVHLVPDSIRETFRYRYGWPDMTEQEIWYRWVEVLDGVRDISIALNEYGKPGDSLVADSIGIIGYYTDFFIYDQFGLVTREVLALPRGGPLIAPPGLDHRVPSDFFDRHQPTFLRWSIVQCSPTDETCSLGENVIEKAEGWRRAVRLLFRRYAPDFSSLPPEPKNGSARVLVVLRAIEEDPSLGIDRLPRRERRRERGRRSRVLWEDFFERARALP